MSNGILEGSDGDELDMTQVEMGLAVLRKACDRAVNNWGALCRGSSSARC